MNVTSAICSHLKADSATAAIASTRVYQNIAEPGATSPYITVQRLPGTDHRHHQTAAAGAVQTQYQINCYASSPVTAESLFDAVRLAMDGLARSTLGASPNNVTVTTVRLRDDFGDYDSPIDGDAGGVHSIKSTWSVWHTETVPTF